MDELEVLIQFMIALTLPAIGIGACIAAFKVGADD